MKLAEALITRKQLVQKIGEINALKDQADKGFFKTTVVRIKATDPIPGAEQGSIEQTGSDDVKTNQCLITPVDIYKYFDEHATSLRKLDAAIQQANWAHEITEVKLPKGLE